MEDVEAASRSPSPTSPATAMSADLPGPPGDGFAVAADAADPAPANADDEPGCSAEGAIAAGATPPPETLGILGLAAGGAVSIPEMGKDELLAVGGMLSRILLDAGTCWKSCKPEEMDVDAIGDQAIVREALLMIKQASACMQLIRLFLFVFCFFSHLLRGL